MRRIYIFTCAALLVLLISNASKADTLILKDGTSVTGTLVGVTATTISFKDAHGVLHRYKKIQVGSLEFSATKTVTPIRAVSPRQLEVLPVGTELAIRTNENIDSKVAKENQVFAAEFARDVLGASGAVVIPKGSPAELVIRKASTGGITGSPEMMLDVQAIKVSGHRYVISTADLEQKGDTGMGMNKRTAEMVGGGAVVGTVLGAVLGGGKGAAIGVVTGTAAGAGAQVLLKGKEVKVPTETILNFKLDQPLSWRAG